MKKKLWMIGLAAVLLVAVLTVPIPLGAQADGTREYAALTYKIIDWNRPTADGEYQQRRIYPFPDNFRSTVELWQRETEAMIPSFLATVIEQNEKGVLVEPLEGEDERNSCDRIYVSFSQPEAGLPRPNSTVRIRYEGLIMESYPAQLRGLSWEYAEDLRQIAYTGQWLDKTAAKKLEDTYLSEMMITQIYADCFFARPVIPMPYTVKFNGILSEDWCVGDQITTTQENVYYDQKNSRMEADLLSIAQGTFTPEPGVCYKPVIYLYPEQKTEVSVRLRLTGGLTCAYPAYDDGWRVTAMPDGTLTDAAGKSYNYLYWEGVTDASYDMSRGFCVKGEDTAAFLEEALEKLGLTRREANEFIVYWLPLMQENPYNIIAFQQEAYTDAAQLAITPAPDTLIRVFMTWQAADSYVKILPQHLTAPARQGFTVVEWGGTQLGA